MYLYGASGHGKVVWNILHDLAIEVNGFIDDDPDLRSFLNLPVYSSSRFPDDCNDVIVSIGNNQTRSKVVTAIQKQLNFRTAIHATSYRGYEVTIGPGTVIMQNATLQIGTKVGNHCIINTAASIDHECVIGDFAHISPNATLSGQVVIGDYSWVGAGAVIKQCVTIGKNCIIGAGAVVLDDIPDNCTAVGVPARILKG